MIEESTYEKAIAILAKTNDGDDLKHFDLCLLQAAVNGNLTQLGKLKFDRLYEDTISQKGK